MPNELEKKIKFLLNRLLILSFLLSIMNKKSAVRLFKFIIKKYALRKKIPDVAILALTYRCQCSCSHCSAGLYQLCSKELEIEEWKRVIDQLDSLGIPRVHISGGEPTLKKGFEEIIKYAGSKGMIIFLETNGGTLDRRTMQVLKSNRIASIDVSLDSADPQAHDKMRGREGTFDKAMETIKLCGFFKIPHMISTHATREKIFSGELIRLIEFAKNLKISAVRILPSYPSGRWLNNYDVCLKEEEKIYLRDRFPLFTILDRTELYVCPIKTKHVIFVAPDGELLPCPHLPFSFGNIRDISIDEAMDKMSKSSMFGEKSVCYITDPHFREKHIMPILSNHEKLPVRI